MSAYSPNHEDEIGFEKGVLVEVFEKGLDGWWKIRYKGKEGMGPAAYLQKYHGEALEATAPIQVVSSVKEAVQSVASSSKSSGPTSPTSPKGGRVQQAAATPQQFAPTFHSLAKPYIDKEPIYAPTPRRYSIKQAPLKKRLATLAQNFQPNSTSPPSSPTDSFTEDGPEPVYEVVTDPVEQVYMTIAEFKAAKAGDGLSFDEGEEVSVITKNPTGWWYVELGGQEGWVPSSYLEKQPRSKSMSPKHKSPVSVSPPPPALPARNGPSALPGKKPTVTRSSRSSEALVDRKPAVRKSPSIDNILESNRPPKVRVTPTKSISPPSSRKAAAPKTQSSQSKFPASPKLNRVPGPSTTKPKSPAAPPRKLSAPAMKTETKKSPPTIRAIRVPSQENDPKPQVQPMPAPRKPTVSRTVSDKPRPTQPRTAKTLHPGGARSALELTGHPHKSLTATRKVDDETDTGHMSELEKALSKRVHVEQERKPVSVSRSVPATNGHSASTRPSGSSTTPRRTPPGPPKPFAPKTSATLGAKKIPPKRPEPPKNLGPKKPGPPRPANSPAVKKKLTHVTICDYAGSTDGCVSFKEGEKVEVVEKSDDGWWYVKIGSREGWAPSTFMDEESKPKPARPVERPAPKPKASPVPKPRPRAAKPGGSIYRAIATYEVPAYESSGVAVTQGRLYELLEKNDSWWYMKDGDKEGWAPASYFEEL